MAYTFAEEMDWHDRLAQLVAVGEDSEFPLVAYRVLPPKENGIFPDKLPHSESIRQFYAICDGGSIADYEIAGICEIEALNENWRRILSGYYPDGSSPLGDRHLVLGTDSGGAPLIWDSESDRMSTFWFKGGDWEALGSTLGDFLQDLLFPKELVSGDLWHQALALLPDNSEQVSGGNGGQRP
jgi:hypothetical protein